MSDSKFSKLFDCFVISLERTPERLKIFREKNRKSQVDFQHFKAVDGALLNLSDIYGSVVAANATRYTSGMIGNAMSHRTLWQRCVDQENNFIVCEDDAVLRDDFKARLTPLVEGIGEWDIIQLGYNLDVPLEIEISPGIICGGGFSVTYPSPDQLADFARSTNVVALHRLNFSLGVCGYAISPKGARTLLDTCFPMDNRPVLCVSVSKTFPAFGLDCLMATLYPKIAAYACVAPLVMTPNDRNISLTKRG